MKRTRKIAVLCGGGTIAMKSSPDGLVPDPEFPARLEEYLAGEQQQHFLNRYFTVKCEIIPLNPAIDSTSARPDTWLRLAEEVRRRREDYDGFVILHGTDTLAYSASALTWLLSGLKKSVILTGAQSPFPSKGARNNILGALNYASADYLNIRAVFFDRLLLNGATVQKVDANGDQAFDTINYDHWAKLALQFHRNGDIYVRINSANAAVIDDAVRSRRLLRESDFLRHKTINFQEGAVGLLHLTPALPESAYMPMLYDSQVQMLILLSYGVGNVPQDQRLRQALLDAQARGVRIYNLSQCQRGVTRPEAYAVGGGHLGLLTSDLPYEGLYTALHCQLAGESSIYEETLLINRV